MSNKKYSEDSLQKWTAEKLQTLGWDSVYAYDKETFGDEGTLGRTEESEVLLKRTLRSALKRLNPWISDKQTNEAVERLASHNATAHYLATNEEKYNLICHGVDVQTKNADGNLSSRKALLIDFDHPDNNEFVIVRELKIKDERGYYERRPDLVGFVNGIPLLFIELKRHDVDVRNAYDDNYQDYLDTIPHLFRYNAFVMLSNGNEAKVGTLGSKWEFFHEWKRLKEEDEGCIDLETMIMGICPKDNFLDLLQNFFLFDHSGGKIVKILARNHQYIGVNLAVEAYRADKLRNEANSDKGKIGVFWHTQGSGKSYSMAFFAQKVRHKFEGSPTIVVLTDREELNNQISSTFENCGLLGSSPAKNHIAQDGDDLVRKLKGNPSFIFTLIQKFNKPNAKPINTKHDIIVMSDEAHRTQYGQLAENMMRLLPTCSRIGFTGTPLSKDDEITRRTFGDYISIYDFNRAIEDHATVPLYYENRGEKLDIVTLDKLDNKLNQRMAEAIENADLDPAQQEKVEREFAKQIHLLTTEKRLDSIAKDFVDHYADLWTSGKAMFVCLNKVTCVRMYNYVQTHWQEKIAETKKLLKKASDQETQELEKKIQWLEETEMCVVISQEQNEIQTFKKWGLDILPHREKMVKRSLENEFKDKDNPFRVVFVCAMWLTGFDVKTLSLLYLDKPLRAHTLMQTIARANRVAEGKSNGLIIDYIGILKELREALAQFTVDRNNGGDGKPGNGGGKNGGGPITDKSELIRKIKNLIKTIREFLKDKGFDLDRLINSKVPLYYKLVKEGAEAVSVSLDTRKKYQRLASELTKLFKYVSFKEVDDSVIEDRDAIIAIYNELQKARKSADITDLMVAINKIVNEYVVITPNEPGTKKQFDISKIDFSLLRSEFEKSTTKHLVLNNLCEMIEEKLKQMLKDNPERINFYEKYLEIAKEYNKEQDRAVIEQTFEDLMNLAKDLDEESKRFVKEGFSNEEELAVFDMLFNDKLSKKDIKAIKKVAIDLLEKIKSRIAELDHWTDKEETRENVGKLIADTLWEKLPECYPNESITLYKQKIYEYISDRYAGHTVA